MGGWIRTAISFEGLPRSCVLNGRVTSSLRHLWKASFPNSENTRRVSAPATLSSGLDRSNKMDSSACVAAETTHMGLFLLGRYSFFQVYLRRPKDKCSKSSRRRYTWKKEYLP